MEKDIFEYLQRDDTAEFLQKVSRRLSGRKDCNHLEFEVAVDFNRVSIIPPIYVFPDTHHRAEIDKMLVTDYILKQMPKYSLTSGVYKYQRVETSSRKRRRWVRIL